MILNIYKPPGMTSHDVVDEVRKITSERRVGHAGTLDPFAEGVLIVGVGRESTKKLGKIAKNTEKEYIATIELGKVSTTGDPTGTIKDVGRPLDVRRQDIEMVLEKFKGEIEQTPPKYSAIKIKGKPVYKYAREGKEVELAKRKVKIYELELLEYNPPMLKIRAVVSAGTYIRTLAEDVGSALGTGAYLKKLVRVRVGEYKIEDSKKLTAEFPTFLSRRDQ